MMCRPPGAKRASPWGGTVDGRHRPHPGDAVRVDRVVVELDDAGGRAPGRDQAVGVVAGVRDRGVGGAVRLRAAGGSGSRPGADDGEVGLPVLAPLGRRGPGWRCHDGHREQRGGEGSATMHGHPSG
jgi:hypothetical protein